MASSTRPVPVRAAAVLIMLAACQPVALADPTVVLHFGAADSLAGINITELVESVKSGSTTVRVVVPAALDGVRPLPLPSSEAGLGATADGGVESLGQYGMQADAAGAASLHTSALQKRGLGW